MSLDTLARRLQTTLGDNLYSLVLYGSAVRGEYVPGVSDVNLMLVLNASTPAAHQLVAGCLRDQPRVDPFVIGRPGLQRSMQTFAVKFRSIRRDYRVLHGADPFVEFDVAPEVLQFLCEQALRNLRLRVVRGFVLHGEQPKAYLRFLQDIAAQVFIDLSEALRLKDIEVPHDFADRATVLAQAYGVDASILNDLLALKEPAARLKAGQSADLHTRLYALLDQAIAWMEAEWPRPW